MSNSLIQLLQSQIRKKTLKMANRSFLVPLRNFADTDVKFPRDVRFLFKIEDQCESQSVGNRLKLIQ